MMTRLPMLLVAGSLLLACAPETESAADTPPAAELSAEEAALEAIRVDYVARYNAGDAAGVAGLHDESAFGLWADGTVSTGRDEILANLQETLGGSPTLELSPGGSFVSGDNAVGHGHYTVSMSPEGAGPMTMSGHYMTHFTRTDGQWRIAGVITNYDGAPPEGMPMGELPEETPADEGTMQEFVQAYAAAVNAADWAALSSMYTDDAVVAFSNLELMEGPAAVAAAYEGRFGTTPPVFEAHDVGTRDLGNGHALDGGWYRLTVATPEGDMVQTGTWMSLVQQQADGSWKIRWQVTNGQPKPAT
jgi:uncharacterized protein (TIGR02246 family)